MQFPQAYAAAYAAARAANDHFHDKLHRGLTQYPPHGRSEAALSFGHSRTRPHGFLTLTDQQVRNAASSSLIRSVLAHHARVRRDKTVRTFLATFAWDAGLTFEDHPRVSLEAMERAVRRCLVRLGLDAVCAFEVDVFSRRVAGEQARRVQFHIHAVCWTRNTGFQPVSVGEALSNSRAFRTSSGVPSVSFVSRAQSAAQYGDFARAHPEMDQTAASMAWLAYYLLKAPHFTKNRYRGRDGRIRMRGDAQRFLPRTALRVAEVLSQISAFDAVFAVGPEAARVGADYAARLRSWERTNQSGTYYHDEVALKDAWATYFARRPELGFVSSDVRHRRHTLNPGKA